MTGVDIVVEAPSRGRVGHARRFGSGGGGGDRDRDLGDYWEPNIWIIHPSRLARAPLGLSRGAG